MNIDLLVKLKNWAENIVRNPMNIESPFAGNPQELKSNIGSLGLSLVESDSFFSSELQQIKEIILMTKNLPTMYGMQPSLVLNPIIFKELLLILRYLHANIRPPKVFISHATDDKDYISKFVNMLEKMGIQQSQLFCSSVPGYGIPQSKNIYDHLRDEFNNYDLYVILMLSKNYYKSKACLNEMGAAWVLKAQYQTILLPGYSFRKIDGAIDPRQMSFSLGNLDNRESGLDDMKNTIVSFLSLNDVAPTIWERHRTDFLTDIDKLTT